MFYVLSPYITAKGAGARPFEYNRKSKISTLVTKKWHIINSTERKKPIKDKLYSQAKRKISGHPQFPHAAETDR